MKIKLDKDFKQGKFLSLLKSIDRSKRESEIFSDLIIMASAALYSWKRDEKVENQYLEKAKGYNKEQLGKFAELIAYITIALTEEEKDFLGGIYQHLNMGNKKLSQHFTPQRISDAMAEITLQPEVKPKPGKVTTILDPCCGSGVMLISAVKVLKMQSEKNIEHALFVGQDIDTLCAHMTFIQLSLLGVPAIVKCGDTLSGEVIWYRETLWYHTYKIEEKLEKEDIFCTHNEPESFPA
jgi:type I restriction-modification system DNA methylase subunit